MKKWLFMAALLLTCSALPSPGTELGELHPVSVLLVDNSGRQVVAQTDTGQLGAGETLPAALLDLKETTPGHIFLDTVEYLVLQGNAQRLLPDLQQQLRPGVRVCTADEGAEAESLTEFLKSHPPKAKLSELTAESPLQNIQIKEGRQLLEE